MTKKREKMDHKSWDEDESNRSFISEFDVERL